MVKNRDKHSKRKGVIVIDDQVIDSEEGQETSHLQKKGKLDYIKYVKNLFLPNVNPKPKPRCHTKSEHYEI